ncbi:hypothetical protein ACQEVB_24255 [Pseudonocardia sp. CA-107938]|uniref:hypothetical protein n=1 Tax=Pseudonocardia sp. CA-107938 TaxID=3240021 RepID=UPI003D8AF64C
MYVVIREDEVLLAEPDVFTAFHATIDPRMDRAQIVAVLDRHDVGTVSEDGTHLWVRVDAVRKLAAGHVDPGWDAGLAAMLTDAARKGWTSADGREVRAHVEPSHPAG